MAFTSNGQISYLVLDSLSESSKYGLEIIEYISKKTNGGFVMKKPTLYSCLTRMEKKGLVSSSYWGESELGGKRHYYTITSAGRECLAELEKTIDVTQQPPVEEIAKPKFLQQDNLFDMEKPKQKPATVVKEEKDEILENQIDIFNMDPVPQNEAKEDKEKIDYYQSILESSPEKEDDGVFLTEEPLTDEQEEQNRRLYDTSSELKKYRKRKSFSENQIEMAVVYEKPEDSEIQKARIAELKRSILNLKDGHTADLPEQEQAEEEEVLEPLPQEESIENPVDDGVFITEPRMSANEIPVQRKITPPNIEVNVYDDNLPAPKRDSALEPSYKDILSKVFERRKEKPLSAPPKSEQIQEYQAPQTFGDYTSLKKHYQSRGIDFKEYRKSTVNRHYNTNLLQMINSIILFTLSGICSAILFWIISASEKLQSSTNFLFYTLPLVFLLYVIYSVIKYRFFASKKASLKYSTSVNWIVFLLGSLIVVLVNTICGMQVETMSNYLTSLLVPIANLLILFPIHFYSKKILYRKYSK